MADTSETAPEQPQLYLITPPEFDLLDFPGQLARVLDARAIACVRLALATRDEDRIGRAADACREVAHARDVPLVIDSHWMMVERHGLDGVHLGDGARSVRKIRAELGADAVVGAFCGVSRHDGMSAGEAGADYIAFGPVTEGLTGSGEVVSLDTFAWWSEVIEVPVVAEGRLTPDMVAALADKTDFFGIGDEIWTGDDPVAALNALVAVLD
ncbi:thiamine phosphate synthase [Tropicimonas sp. S265A]|uniref:thiamine phosphate synthase n=1 Tax=Tropicimonas sp. S265A TaxID=3415134 RepID=UPI003C7B9853